MPIHDARSLLHATGLSSGCRSCGHLEILAADADVAAVNDDSDDDDCNVIDESNRFAV